MMLTKSVSFAAWQFNVVDNEAYKYLGLLRTATIHDVAENLPNLLLGSVSVGASIGANCEQVYHAYVETMAANTPYGNVSAQRFTIQDGQWLIEDDTTLGTFKVVNTNELLLITSK